MTICRGIRTPWHANIAKRLVKSPRIYLRDTGLLHHLLGLATLGDLLGHPRLGASREGFAIENIIATLPARARASFYRSAAGTEIDLVLTLPGHRRPWAIEVKRGRSPRLERGFHHACEAVDPERRLVVCGTEEPFSVKDGIEAIGLHGMLELLRG